MKDFSSPYQPEIRQANEWWIYKNPLEEWMARHFSHNLSQLDPIFVKQRQWHYFQELIVWLRENSYFYKEKLAKCSISSFTEIDRIPLTTTEDLRADWKDFLCVSQSQIERMVTVNESSGTMGLPKRLAFGDDDIESIRDYFQAGMSHIVKPGNRVLILMPGGNRPYTVASLFVEAMPILGAEGKAAGPDITKEIIDYQPDVLVAMPQQLEKLLHEFSEKPCINLTSILSSAAFLNKKLAEAIMTKWNVALLDHYASTESAYCGAVACGPMADYHIDEWDLYVEIIDPITLQVSPDGTYGEIVISTLRRRNMPLLRYRSGDISALESGQCPHCGSLLRRLKPIAGRLLFTDGGRSWKIHHPPKNTLGSPALSLQNFL